MHDSYIFQFFQRMRIPLVVLISAYAIATVGFTLMPGVDDEGNPWRLSLFEAFYVVSYTGSTIGFGEVPYEFSAAQRMWTMVSIYLTVFAWLFSIGSIISLLQDPAFRSALQRSRFRRAVRAIDRPFYLVCGHGDTGRLLAKALTDRHFPVVVIDHNPDKIDALSVEQGRAPISAYCMDARLPDNLVEAGLRSRWFMGVLAVTSDSQVNLKIAISGKLLNRRCSVHARADFEDVADNMRSFETDQVVSPIDEYVRRMRLAIEQPNAFRLYHWLQSGPDARVPDVREPPRGRWILCGFGALGKAAYEMLAEIGMEVTVIEADPRIPGLPAGTIRGRGTQADTLQEAGIESAVGLLATTSDDVDNLSILMTGRELNDQLFFAVLENGLSSHALFRAAQPDFIGQPSIVIAGAMLSRIQSPLLHEFMEHLIAQPEDLAAKLLKRLQCWQQPSPPELFTLRISQRRAPAIAALIERGLKVPLSAMMRDPTHRQSTLPVEPLMLCREGERLLLPDPATELASGDRLLVAARKGIGHRLVRLMDNENALSRAITGHDIHPGWLWQRLFSKADVPRSS
jgi:voltage-gated potassium channel